MGQILDAAFGKATSTLKNGFPSQRGGTCGLYCLWYASLLLSTCGSAKTVIYPRRCEVLPEQRTEEGSLRRFAKTVGSGQGEIVNLAEMGSIIRHSGYSYAYIQDS